MRIRRAEASLLFLPSGPRTVPVLLARVETDAGASGVGFSPTPGVGARAMGELFREVFAPVLDGEDALAAERLFAKARQAARTIGWRGLAARAYAAVDLALWDLKGKAAGMPVWRLLGAAREEAPVFRSVSAAAAAQERPLTVRGAAGPLPGLLAELDGDDPEADVARVQQVRERFGPALWLAASAGGRYDLDTALGVGHFLEEEVGVDWFEDPLPAGDEAGLARLADRLDVPLASGSALDSPHGFQRLLRAGWVRFLRPDVLRLGGVTPWLKVAALAEIHNLRAVPVRLPEVGMHLACGCPAVPMVEHVPWLEPLFAEPLRVENGVVPPPDRPGWGLELNEEAVGKYRLE